ncbi:MAG TPA: YceI family protein [Candidatus Saccharimonadales bacterium]|nr:YceI family protein [Candidatus Saccharimonadales bacterium]
MTRSRSIAIALVAILAIGAGGYLAYVNVLQGDDVAPLALPSASAAAVDPTAGASADPAASVDPSASTDPTAAASADPGSDAVSGTWTATTGSLAGYRVREQLANLPAESDAVGRTSDVTGSLTVEGSGDAYQVTAGTIEIDTTTIVSDEDRRDDRMREEGLQTDQFPTASFTLTQPLDVPAAVLDGTPAEVTLVGDLTLHGVTKAVEIPAQAQLANGQIAVAGSLTFALSDFEITAPNVGGFIVSIADEGALEFSVVFVKG